MRRSGTGGLVPLRHSAADAGREDVLVGNGVIVAADAERQVAVVREGTRTVERAAMGTNGTTSIMRLRRKYSGTGRVRPEGVEPRTF